MQTLFGPLDKSYCNYFYYLEVLFFSVFVVVSFLSLKTIVTKDACNFVTPLTLSTVSKNPVLSSLISKNNTWNNHVDLASWAELRETLEIVTVPSSVMSI